MNWLNTVTLVVHLLLSVSIIGLVLLQRGKGAEAGAGFGAGASGTVFGARGSASFLSRSTAVLATLFFITSLALAYLGGRPTGDSSVMQAAPATKIEAPAIDKPADAAVVTSEAQPREEPAASTTSAPAATPEAPKQ